MSVRVSPTDRIRGEIDALFDGSRDFGDHRGRRPPGRAVDHPDRVGGRGRRVPGPGPLPAGRGLPGRAGGQPQRLLRLDDQDHRRAGDGGAAEAARHDRGVRLPAVRQGRHQVQRVGVAGDRRVRARPVGARRGEHPGRRARRRGGAVEVDGLAGLPGDRRRVRPVVGSAPGRPGAGLPVPGRVDVQDASRCPRRTGARGVGHHHRRRAGVRRAGRRRIGVHRRLGRLPRRTAGAGAAPAAAGHLRRRGRADQRRRDRAAPLAAATLSDPSLPQPAGQGARRGADARSATPTGRSSTPTT